MPRPRWRLGSLLEVRSALEGVTLGELWTRLKLREVAYPGSFCEDLFTPCSENMNAKLVMLVRLPRLLISEVLGRCLAGSVAGDIIVPILGHGRSLKKNQKSSTVARECKRVFMNLPSPFIRQ